MALSLFDRLVSHAMQIKPPNAMFVDDRSFVWRVRAHWVRNSPEALLDRVVADLVRRTLVTALSDDAVKAQLNVVVQGMTRSTLLALTGDLAKEK